MTGTTSSLEGPPSKLQLLLVGKTGGGLLHSPGLLRAHGGVIAADLDHELMFGDALEKLAKRSYDLVLFEYDSSEEEALRILQELRRQGKTTPFLFLTEHGDESGWGDVN